jgi:hypothetical protein
LQLELRDAEQDGTLNLLASTFDPQSDRLSIGISKNGPRLLDFAGILRLKQIPLNDVVKTLLNICKRQMDQAVEIEFAVTMHPPRLGFLQVRPMALPAETVEIADADLAEENVLLASEQALGNGSLDEMQDIVYVRPDQFDMKHTKTIAAQIEQMNRRLIDQSKPYLLIGFGRWGSSDPWLGIPVNWGQVSGAKCIVEARLENMNIDLSQGSHFFHNLLSFRIPYFSTYKVDWDWLLNQSAVHETDFVRHVRVTVPLKIRVDGRSRRAVIVKGS